MIDDFPAPTPLAIAKPRPLSGGVTPRAYYEVTPAPEFTTALHDRAQQNDLDVSTLIQGAWALLLSHYSGEADATFGMLVSHTPILTHTTVQPEQEARAWLTALQANSTTTRQPEPSHLETLLVFGSHAKDAHAAIPFIITVDGDLRLRIDYDADRFETAAVARLADHLLTLLEGFVSTPELPLKSLPMLTKVERQQMLVAWNDTTTDTGYIGQCIHRRFERQAAQTPEAVAVVYAEPGKPRQTLTYGDLNARANQLAQHLQELGVGPEVPVAICVARSTVMLVGMLGILKAGGAYLPIDPAYPPDRQAFMLADTQTPVLLTESALVDALPSTQAHIICLDADWPAIAAHADTNLDDSAQGHNLAYVIYTSGSTGQPKGVEIAHQSVINLIEATRPVFGFNADDVWTVFHSYAFDFSVWEIWTPLLCGSRLVIVPQTVVQSPTAFLELLRAEHVTIVNQTPSALQRLVDLHDAADPLSLRLICCGGEAMPRALAQKVLAWDIPLWNFYGPTESTVWAACGQVTTAGDAPSVPVGQPLGNIRLYILDQALQPVPVGIPGELYISGVGLARGYFNRPQLTAEKFVPNPFSTEPGARLYKTGDAARYLENGDIEFLQRLDNQVKIRGFRVELGEIESALARHPAVRQAVAVVHPGTDGDPRLITYWTTSDPSIDHPATGELQNFLKQRLPAYMIPGAFVHLDALPLTPNGKIDRRRLPAPDATRPTLTNAYVAPRTPTETTLAHIWETVLQTAPVGVHDNFFELGGDSLLALNIIAEARAAGLLLTVQHLFEYQTIAALSAATPARPLPPSSTDFPDVDLTQEELEALLVELGDILT
ncbi:MAG: amino acid adenylation domain-containing protein [Anaerolineae bacterium]|nr:amino acid adenylation domain-containing protein [Anaerolineae bacterium]